jgi:hypothetical protein
MSPEVKNLGVLNKENERAILLVHLVLLFWRVVQEFPKMQEENVVEHNHA